MATTKIYLVTNCYGDPNKVYVGKTMNSRKKDHQKTYGKQITYDYIDEINSLNRKDWKPLESFWIRYFKFLGFEIMNGNEGGNGPEYCKAETRLKIGMKNKFPKPGVSQKLTGRKSFHKEDTGDKISIAKKGAKQSEQHVMNRSKSMKGNQNRLGTTQSESAKEKARQALIGIPKSKEHIKNMSVPRINKENFGKKRKGTKFSEEWVNKMRKSALSRAKPVIQYDLKGNKINEFIGVREASRQTGIYESAIIMCCKGKLKTTHKFIFKYV